MSNAKATQREGMIMLTKRLQSAVRRARLPRESIAAVHDDDLRNFLASIGATNDVASGKIHCKFCRDPITLETLQAVFPDSGSISYVCQKQSCLRQFIKYLKEIHGH